MHRPKVLFFERIFRELDLEKEKGKNVLRKSKSKKKVKKQSKGLSKDYELREKKNPLLVTDWTRHVQYLNSWCRCYIVGSHHSKTTSIIGASVDKMITLIWSSHGYWEQIKSDGSISQSFWLALTEPRSKRLEKSVIHNHRIRRKDRISNPF